ncbi:MAG TPA: hypothetical protein ENI94_02755 [Gammaproteobacteria bacterium]|nr:hypothetical protein [Gammaproteobacteria bacterium]
MDSPMPEQIRFLFNNSNGVIKGLIVFFIVRSKMKNNFTVGPLVTGENGDVLLTKYLVEEVISNSKNDFPMDYAGELIDCDLLGVLVESKTQLEDRVKRLNVFYPDNAFALQEMLENSANNTDSLYKEIEFPIKDNEIIVDVA